ncbi:MAG: 50S ribosomal protein L22 [Candidatus Bathyarchaeota archaeon]
MSLPTWGYSVKNLDPTRTAIASARDLRISPKAAREICGAIRGMRLSKAKVFLEEVVALKTAVPFKRYRKEMPHRKGLQGWCSGRYPVKSAKEILKVLDSVEANAGERGLDPDRLKLIHAAAQRSFKIKKYIQRAFGRSSPFFQELTHVEVAVFEI